MKKQVNVEVYVVAGCWYCEEALETLSNKGIKYVIYEIVNGDRSEMIRRTGGPDRVPQIFINNQRVKGGCGGLDRLDECGVLNDMLYVEG